MKLLIASVLAALALSSGTANADEFPPPPYDPEGTVPVDFTSFYAIEAKVFDPYYMHSVVWANSPEEGIRLCAYFVKYDGYTNDPKYWCRVDPIKEMPDVTQPGWIDQFAPDWA